MNKYILIHTDPNKSIRSPYQMVTINYFPTSVERYYRIGTSGDWLTYNDEPIKVDQGQTIYAYGVDNDGNETRITSSYTADSTDALKVLAYDKNPSTYDSIFQNATKYFNISPSVTKFEMRYWGTIIVKFYDASDNELYSEQITGNTTKTFSVPAGTVKVELTALSTNPYIYELIPVEE